MPGAHLDAAYHLSVMKGYEIRVAVAADADVLKDLHRQSSLVYEDTRAILIAHPEIFGVSDAAIRAGHVRVLVSDGRIVAFSTVIPRPDGTGEMEDLFVEPKSMRQGLGRELIDDAIAIARTRGLQRIEVTANPNAMAFYAKVGFVLDGEVPTEFGSGSRMHLDLRS